MRVASCPGMSRNRAGVLGVMSGEGRPGKRVPCVRDGVVKMSSGSFSGGLLLVVGVVQREAPSLAIWSYRRFPGVGDDSVLIAFRGVSGGGGMRLSASWSTALENSSSSLTGQPYDSSSSLQMSRVGESPEMVLLEKDWDMPVDLEGVLNIGESGLVGGRVSFLEFDCGVTRPRCGAFTGV